MLQCELGRSSPPLHGLAPRPLLARPPPRPFVLAMRQAATPTFRIDQSCWRSASTPKLPDRTARQINPRRQLGAAERALLRHILLMQLRLAHAAVRVAARKLQRRHHWSDADHACILVDDTTAPAPPWPRSLVWPAAHRPLPLSQIRLCSAAFSAVLAFTRTKSLRDTHTDVTVHGSGTKHARFSAVPVNVRTIVQ